MDLRNLALKSVVIALAAAFTLATASVAGEEARRDSLTLGLEGWTSLELQDLESEGSLDAAELAELDDLLADPVSLSTGHLDRLRAVPGIGEVVLDALRAARHVASLEDLARLPGWDADLARRVAPYVRFASPRPGLEPGQEAEIRTRVRQGRREARVRAEAGPWTAGWHDVSSSRTPAAAFVHLESQRVEAVAGDLRVACAQGLLWSSGARLPRAGVAGTSALSRGLVASDAMSRGRVLRGAGIEVRRGRSAILLAAGDHDSGRTRGAALSIGIAPKGAIEAALLRCGDRRGASLGLRWEGTGRRAGLEIAFDGRRPGLAAAGEWRKGAHRLAVRSQGVARAFDAPLSSLPVTARRDAARFSQLALSTRRWNTEGECDLLEEVRRGSVGERREAREAIFRLEWRAGRDAVRVRLRERRTRLEKVEEEHPGAVVRQEMRSESIAASRLLSESWRALLEYRHTSALRALSDEWIADEETDSTGTDLPLPEEGSAWQLRCERRGRRAHAEVALASFRSSAGGAGLVLAEPSAGGGGIASWRPKGEGLRLAGALRLRAPHVELGLRAGLAWTGASAPRGNAEAVLSLRHP